MEEDPHALDHFRCTAHPVAAGLFAERWRRPHPHIARDCRGCVDLELAYRPKISGLTRPDQARLRMRQRRTFFSTGAVQSVYGEKVEPWPSPHNQESEGSERIRANPNAPLRFGRRGMKLQTEIE